MAVHAVDRQDHAGRRRSSGLLVCASLLWGTTGTAQALAHLTVAPALVGAARLGAGAATLLVVCLISGRRRALLRAFSPPLRWWTLSAGAATALYQVSFFSAVAKTGVALGTVATLGSAPVFCGLLARWLLGEGVRASWAVATACAVAGCRVALITRRCLGVPWGPAVGPSRRRLLRLVHGLGPRPTAYGDRVNRFACGHAGDRRLPFGARSSSWSWAARQRPGGASHHLAGPGGHRCGVCLFRGWPGPGAGWVCCNPWAGRTAGGRHFGRRAA